MCSISLLTSDLPNFNFPSMMKGAMDPALSFGSIWFLYKQLTIDGQAQIYF